MIFGWSKKMCLSVWRSLFCNDSSCTCRRRNCTWSTSRKSMKFRKNLVKDFRSWWSKLRPDDVNYVSLYLLNGMEGLCLLLIIY